MIFVGLLTIQAAAQVVVMSLAPEEMIETATDLADARARRIRATASASILFINHMDVLLHLDMEVAGQGASLLKEMPPISGLAISSQGHRVAGKVAARRPGEVESENCSFA